MVHSIKSPGLRLPPSSPSKKNPKEVDARIKKAIKKSKPLLLKKGDKSHASSQKITTEQAYLAAEKTSNTARMRAFEARKAALLAQKKAFLAERASLSLQAAALKRARAAEKARKEAEKAARKTISLRKIAKIKAYLARPEGKRMQRIKKRVLTKKKKRQK